MVASRPPIPRRCINPKIAESRSLPPVKYQILNCQGKDILVGRLKVETPTDTGHAFILRRFDTNAISLTTMFRAAFPTATEADEKAEINWVRENFDLSGNNGSMKDMHITRLAGTWVSPPIALQLSKDYGLQHLIDVVVEAKPDPAANYRRSGKASATAATPAPPPAPPAPATTVQSATVIQETVTTTTTTTAAASPKPPSASKTLPTPSPTSSNPPTKRRKASSPAPSSPRPSRIPALASPAPTPATERVIAPLRRSTRASPAPTRSAATTVVRTPKATRSAIKKEASSSVTVTVSSSTPAGGELTVVDEETMAIEDGVIGSGLHEEDMAEQKELLKEMAKKRAAAKEEEVEEVEPVEVAKPSVKRSLEAMAGEEDKPVLTFNPGKEEEDRVIATNKRVKAQGKAQSHSVLWGVAAFAFGVGVTFVPNFF